MFVNALKIYSMISEVIICSGPETSIIEVYYDFILAKSRLKLKIFKLFYTYSSMLPTSFYPATKLKIRRRRETSFREVQITSFQIDCPLTF